MSLYIPCLTMRRPNVARCLFERPTAEKQEKDFEKQESRLFDQDAKVFREKWGLDPITGTIVSGAEYDCVPVAKESIPSFYSKGYAPRRPRPVQSLRRERSQGLYIIPTRLNFDCPKSMKRKHSSDDEVIGFDRDENCEFIYEETDSENKRVPVDGEIVITTASDNLSNSAASSSLPYSLSATIDASNSPISLPMSRLFHSTNMVKSPSMPDISPRSTDLCTPQQRPRNLTQKTIKDYLPCKKARCVTKVLPRT